MEKQDSDVAKRTLTEAHERNEDLLKRNEDLLKRNDDLIKKIEESGKIATHLQESLQRCICIFLMFHFSQKYWSGSVLYLFNFNQTIIGNPSINRLEGKAANLEAENHVLRQQATATPPSTAKSPALRSKTMRIHVMHL